VADVHRLPEGPAGWRLDDHTVEVARVGIARAREALRLARIAVADRDASLAMADRPPIGDVAA